MIRTLLALWIVPTVLFWAWYFLSLNDMNFGYVMLSRQLHDVAFEIYGEMLGLDPAVIPGLIARACVFDSLLVGALVAYRCRRSIVRWIKGPTPMEQPNPMSGAGPELPAE